MENHSLCGRHLRSFLPSGVLKISSFTLKKQLPPTMQAVSFKHGMPSNLTWVQFSKHNKSIITTRTTHNKSWFLRVNKLWLVLKVIKSGLLILDKPLLGAGGGGGRPGS